MNTQKQTMNTHNQTEVAGESSLKNIDRDLKDRGDEVVSAPGSPVHQLVHVSSSPNFRALDTALSNTMADGTPVDVNAPHVRFFYWHDSCLPKKAKSNKGDQKAEEKKVKAVKKEKVKAAKRGKSGRKDGRRRVLAYVWVGDTVFYAGSVFNPKERSQSLIPNNSRAVLMDGLINMINDVIGEAALQSRSRTTPTWNKTGERRTAYSRLRRRPLAFRTQATTHYDIRREVLKHVFQRGVRGERR